MQSPAPVGIGVPVYNGARFLAESLESLVTQTYSDIELVISDNGSTDETEEICREFAARDSRIRYLRTDVNKGAAWNFNRVAHETSGRYFKWATHDDLVAPTFVQRCVEMLEDAPDTVALVYPRTLLIDEEGNPLHPYADNLDIRDPTPHARLRRLVRNIVKSNAAYGLIRRRVVEQSRLLGTLPSADYVMMAEFALLGEFWEISDRLFLRRVHPGMSRGANPSAAAAAEWFKPGSSNGRRLSESWLLFPEHLRSIRSLPLSHREKLLCYAAFVPSWLRRYGRKMVAEAFGVDYRRDWKPLRRAT